MTPNFVNIVAPRLVATAMAVGLVAWAVSGMIAWSANVSVRSLASVIETGGQPRLEVLDRLHQGRFSEGILASCDTSNLRALATISLTELDLAFVTADPIRADRAYEVAEIAVRKSLSCAPLDGNMWLRLAMLDTARRGPSARTLELIRLSYWTAPSEGGIVRARVQFVSRLFAAGMKEVEPELRSDLRMLVKYDSPNSIAEIFVTAPPSVQPIYREWIALLPEERWTRLTKALERHGGALNGK